MLDWSLKSTWDSTYSAYINDARQYEIIGYWRHFQRNQKNSAPEKVSKLINRLSITENTKIAIIGGGFGYLQEEFLIRFPTMSIVTTDTSTWVQSASILTETLDLQSMITGLGLDHTVPGSDGARILNVMDTGLTRSQVTILNEDISTRISQDAVRTEAGIALNVDFDFTISDDVLPTLSDADAITLSVQMNGLGDIVVHIITEGNGNASDLDHNWKFITDWKTLLPSDGVLRVADFEAAS